MKFTTSRIQELARLASSSPDAMNELRSAVERGRELGSNSYSIAWRRIGNVASTAAVTGDLAVVKTMVALGIAPDDAMPSSLGTSTMLHCAVMADETEVLTFLVGLRPNLDVLDGLARTPLRIAAESFPPRMEHAKILAGAGANLTITDPAHEQFGEPSKRKIFRETLQPLQAAVKETDPANTTPSGIWKANGLSAEFRFIRRHSNLAELFRVLTASGEHWAPGDELTWTDGLTP